MQNLVEGREYIATLYNEYYNGYSVHIKYLGLAPEDEGCVLLEVVTSAIWPRAEDGSGDWEAGEFVILCPEHYVFEEFNVVLENK